jgi:hypothetical protein
MLDGDGAFDRFESLRPYRDTLTASRAATQPPRRAVARPPAGRQWRKPWHALGALLDYTVHNTGYIWLDVTRGDEYENPAWNLGEIRGLARAWEQAKPVWDDIHALIAHIDAAPARRLPQLSALLCEDKAMRLALSEPKPHAKKKNRIGHAKHN